MGNVKIKEPNQFKPMNYKQFMKEIWGKDIEEGSFIENITEAMLNMIKMYDTDPKQFRGMLDVWETSGKEFSRNEGKCGGIIGEYGVCSRCDFTVDNCVGGYCKMNVVTVSDGKPMKNNETIDNGSKQTDKDDIDFADIAIRGDTVEAGYFWFVYEEDKEDINGSTNGK